MTRRFLSTLFLFIAFTGFSFAQTDKKTKFHIGLVYPVSSNGTHAMEYTNTFSLHYLAGVSKGETGVALYGFGGYIQDNASGLQLAGFGNYIGNKAHGMQGAGFANYVKNETKGLQAAGFANITGSLTGVQAAGFGNISFRNSKGVQLAGFMNKAANIHTQAAGFINIAKKVKGLQIAGFINIADSSDYPIGLLNIVKQGEKSVGISLDETMTALASFRSGGRVLYGILGLGYNLRSKRTLYGLEAGIGGHIHIYDVFRINIEAVSLFLDDFKSSGEYTKSSLRILPAVKIGGRGEIFAGPTLNYVDYSKNQGEGLISHYLWKETTLNNHFHGLYLGVIGGIHVFL